MAETHEIPQQPESEFPEAHLEPASRDLSEPYPESLDQDLDVDPIEPPSEPIAEADGSDPNEPPPPMPDHLPLSAEEAERAFGYDEMVDANGKPAIESAPAAAQQTSEDPHAILTEEEARLYGPDMEANAKHLKPIVVTTRYPEGELPPGHVRLTDGSVVDLNDPSNHSPERMAQILKLLPEPTEEEQAAVERYWLEHPELSASTTALSDDWSRSLLGALQLLAAEHGTNARHDADAASRRLSFLRGDRVANDQPSAPRIDGNAPAGPEASPQQGGEMQRDPNDPAAHAASGTGAAVNGGTRSSAMPEQRGDSMQPPSKVGSLWNPIAGAMYGLGHSAVSAVTSTIRGSMAAWKEADASRRVERASRLLREMSADLDEVRSATPERRRELFNLIQSKISPMTAAAASAGDALFTVENQERRDALGQKLRSAVNGLSNSTGALASLSEQERRDLSDVLAALSASLQETIKRVLTKIGLADRVGPTPTAARAPDVAPGATAAAPQAASFGPSMG